MHRGHIKPRCLQYNGFDRDDWLNEREAELSVREGAVARAERRLGEKEKKMTVTAN